jgi:hypothetical protein
MRQGIQRDKLGGIDQHWKTRHLAIMVYQSAWKIIRKGGKPSEEIN